jgi:hypothetical protein
MFFLLVFAKPQVPILGDRMGGNKCHHVTIPGKTRYHLCGFLVPLSHGLIMPHIKWQIEDQKLVIVMIVLREQVPHNSKVGDVLNGVIAYMEKDSRGGKNPAVRRRLEGTSHVKEFVPDWGTIDCKSL